MYVRTAIVIAMSLMVASSVTSCKDGQFTELNLSGKQDLGWEVLVANAKSMKEKGKPDQAEAMYKEAAEKCVKAYGENDGRTATCVGYLAELYFEKQDWRVAYETYKRWIKILQEIEPAGDTLKHAKDNYKKIKEKLKQYGLADEIKREQKEKKEQELKEQEQKELQEEEGKLNQDVPAGRKRRIRSENPVPEADSDDEAKDSKESKDSEDSKSTKSSKSDKGNDWDDDSKDSKKSKSSKGGDDWEDDSKKSKSSSDDSE
jgi:hypothetical protein